MRGQKHNPSKSKKLDRLARTKRNQVEKNHTIKVQINNIELINPKKKVNHISV